MNHCYLCSQDPLEQRRYGQQEVSACPVCFQLTCRFHMTTVRWRWRETGAHDSALICKECKRHYAHRNWDTTRREWIT